MSSKRQLRDERRIAERRRPWHPRTALKRAGVKAGPALVALVAVSALLVLIYILLGPTE